MALACSGTSESVGTDVCASGRRWTGGNTSDPEMSPGTDCIACHEANDAPPFIAAGTVYGLLDNQTQIENDCYGLEGVVVEIEDANGRVISTTTNRAGNFYFEGEPQLLPKPYVARLRYTLPDGQMVSPQMVVTQPTYGGCARCHDARAIATPDLDPADPSYVVPVEGLFVE